MQYPSVTPNDPGIPIDSCFEAIANLVPDLLWRNDLDGNAIWYNQRWYDYTGQTIEAAQGEGWLNVIHPDDRAQSTANFHAAIKKNRPLRQEYRIRGSDGNYRWFLVQAQSTIDDRGNILWFAVATNIHEQKTTQEQLRHSEALAQAMIQNFPGGAAFVVDRDLRYLIAEGEALSAAGFKPEDLVGKTIFEVLPPELIASYAVNYRKALAGEPFESEHQSHDRTYISRGTPIRSETEEINAVLVVSYDITNRKRAEEALRESEQKYRSLFNSIDQGYCLIELILNQEGKPIDWLYLEANQSYQRQTGLVDMVGKRLLEFVPNLEPEWFDFYGNVARTGEPARMEYPVQEMERWFTAYASRVGGEGSLWIAIVFEDITDCKRLEQRQAFLLQLSDALRPLADPLVVQEVACRVLGEHLGANRVLYSEMFEDLGSQTLIRVSDYTAGVPSRIGWHRLDDFGKFVTETWRAGRNLLWSCLDDLPNLSPDERAAYEAVEIEAIIGVPLVKEGRFEAFLAVHQATPRKWTADEIALVEETAERTWAAVERARAEEQVRRAAEMDMFRVKLSDALRSLSDAVEIQATVTRTTMNFFGADRCYYCEIIDGSAIIRRDASQADLPSVVGAYPLENSPIFRAMLDAGQPFVFQDVHTTNLLDEDLRQTCVQLQIIAGINVPVIKRGEPVGILCLTQSTPRNWTALEMDLAEEIADRTWATIERTRAEANLREAELQRVREQSAREQERQRAEALAELDRAKTLFFSNISHEFRTPLTLSLAPLQEMLSDRSLLPVHRERLEVVQRNSFRLLKLVNTLLGFSRIEAGRLEAVYEPTDLAQFTIELASVFRSAIERAGLQFIVNCPALPEPVYVDREMWEKIILNLLSNALKFTFTGEITLSLRAESSPNHPASTLNGHALGLELDGWSSKHQRSPSELKVSTSELERSASELEASGSELQILTSELETSIFELETSASELKLSTSKTHVILEIRDTGTGIPPEHLPHLFERFYQVRGAQARSHEGSGIGLALVHELVRLQGGTIEVTSMVGKGTCFTISIPFGTDHLPNDRLRIEGAPRSGSVPDRNLPTRTLASTAIAATSYVQEAERWLVPAENRAAQSNPTSDSSHPTPSPARVLVVDDNADMREYLTRILSDHVQVEAVADGVAAIAAAQAQVPDLILSDVMMPGLDGFGLLKALRADPHTRTIPILLLSARAGEEAIVEGLEAGADDYLIKPFSAQELISRVNTHLQMTQLRGAALHEARNTIRSRDDLLSTVSHELNTPLVSILGWTRLLRSSPPNPEFLSKALDTIERNATLQANLVQDLLDISRISSGKLRLNLQSINLESVVEATIATVAQTAIVKGVELIWQQTTPNAIVRGDRDRLQQVLCNLLTNAIKFTPASGRITVELSIIHADAQIRVTDTGIGITSEFICQVFDRFRQAQGSQKGLGLGLAIARHLVELHHGTIHAESPGLGQGATFIIRLPLLTSMLHEPLPQSSQ